jgi:Protein of unknown function (DUF3089)
MTRGSRRARRLLTCALTTAAAAMASATAASGASATVWLCKPGLKHDPCTPGLSTTTASASGRTLATVRAAATKDPKIDCFYVYPTVSDQPRPQATLKIDPVERSIALYQAARYSSECRVFAPMYRQVTLYGLLNPTKVTAKMRATAYDDVRRAWRDYLEHDNKGRGVVFISHSQGTFELRRLLAEEVDRKPAVRKRLVSAILLGGNVVVRRGTDAGGDFQHIPACRATTQLGCVIAFSTFNDAPPAGTLFGRPSRAFGVGPKNLADLEVLCTNPAALGGGAAPLRTIEPAAPFARGTIAALTSGLGIPKFTTSSTWVETDGAYSGQCSDEGGSDVLRISAAVPEAPVLKPMPGATWGLHLVDANIALGDLIDLVHQQAAAFAAR